MYLITVSKQEVKSDRTAMRKHIKIIENSKPPLNNR